MTVKELAASLKDLEGNLPLMQWSSDGIPSHFDIETIVITKDGAFIVPKDGYCPPMSELKEIRMGEWTYSGITF